MATSHKIPSTYMTFTFLVSQQKIIQIQRTTLEIFGSFNKSKKTCPTSHRSSRRFFLSRFMSSNSSVRKFCLGDASDGRDAPLGDVELFVEAQKLLVDAFRLLLGRVHVPFGEIRKGPLFKAQKKRQVES